ncbi:uncharacterized protein HD556DRAFT_1439558 [Suillus plorans]|uniref:Uncharacterized protein n=1 Tax=Suillus plorans TaxID=116603 RepID=A0A9P7DPK5_9AGAM|nr:uncharacterized protein HD556DRAFT_1439558 [Suillus plorans]KAG1799891.1 hypothetical protein HD556DRAFT_1439558 [Suillus plorans]
MDQCALNVDASLKEACNIQWVHSLTQNTASLPPVDSPSLSPTLPNESTTFTFSTQLTPATFGNTQKHKADNAKSTISKSKGSSTCQNRKDAPIPKVTKPSKPAPIERVKALQFQGLASNTSTAGEESDDEEDEPTQNKRHKKGDGAADILTMFKPVDSHNLVEGYVCQVCKQQSIFSFTETVQRPEEWSQEQLHECIIRFIIETDQALSIVDHDAFQELLHYNRCSKTEISDIPHCTKVTEDIIECTEAI